MARQLPIRFIRAETAHKISEAVKRRASKEQAKRIRDNVKTIFRKELIVLNRMIRDKYLAGKHCAEYRAPSELYSDEREYLYSKLRSRISKYGYQAQYDSDSIIITWFGK
jgi:hypothetical protein